MGVQPSNFENYENQKSLYREFGKNNLQIFCFKRFVIDVKITDASNQVFPTENTTRNAAQVKKRF